MASDGLDELFHGRDLEEATIANIRGLRLKAGDFLGLSPLALDRLCTQVAASLGDVFRISAAVSVAAEHAEPTALTTCGAASEGINSRMYVSRRQETLRKLEALVCEERAVVLRAPSQSGKTSLLQLFHARCLSRFGAVFYISLAGVNGHDMEYMWYKHYPHVPFETLDSPKEPVLLLVDEAQSSGDLALWAQIKAAQLRQSKLHIVLVSNFGSDEVSDDKGLPPIAVAFPPSSTVTIRPQPGVESSGVYIQFSDSECLELWETWCKFCDFTPRSNDLLRYVMDTGDKQPGLMTHMLDWLLGRNFNDKNRADREAFAKRELLSERCIRSLGDIRSISTNSWHAGLLNKMLGSGSALGHVGRNELSFEEKAAANMLLASGQLVRTLDLDFVFPSALHRHYYASLTATGKLTISQVRELGIEDFLANIIQRMSASNLRSSRSREGILYERQYQNEFYRAYCTLLSVAMSPDFGKMYGVSGYVDYYLEALEWAFEIARGGIKLGEHLDRFRKLVQLGVVKEYVLVDMESRGIVYEDEPGLIQVVFTHDYSGATIYPSGRYVTLL